MNDEISHDAHPVTSSFGRMDGVVPETECLWLQSPLLKLLSRGISAAEKTSFPLDLSSQSSHLGTE